MIFRQLFDHVSSTYTYLIASRKGGEALIIDPVLERIDRYLTLIGELDLKLVKAIDTHLHADHITGIGALRDKTNCITVMGKQSNVDVVSMRVSDGDHIDIESLRLDVIYTPGHTDDSYSFLMEDRVFTGDTLLIRGTGRTDFQNGDPYMQYDSIFKRLLTLPEDTLVYPAHDYKGDTVSTIGEESAFNPRLQVGSREEYADMMNALDLPDPKMMDVAVPANMKIGYVQEDIAKRGWVLSPPQAVRALDRSEAIMIDLREDSEREKDGVIPHSIHVPFMELKDSLSESGVLHGYLANTDKHPLFICSYGERSAMAVQAAQDLGFTRARHVEGGIRSWRATGGLIE